METFLIFIGLVVVYHFIRAVIRNEKAESIHNEIMSEIRRENPNYDKEVKESLIKAQERLRRQDLYIRAQKKLGNEIGYGYQELCNDDETWAKMEKEILDALK